MITLQELYRRYMSFAAKPGEPVPLSAFQFTVEQTEKLFSVYDEDYHFSRFFHFNNAGGQTYSINGEPVSHVVIDPEITTTF